MCPFTRDEEQKTTRSALLAIGERKATVYLRLHRPQSLLPALRQHRMGGLKRPLVRAVVEI